MIWSHNISNQRENGIEQKEKVVLPLRSFEAAWGALWCNRRWLLVIYQMDGRTDLNDRTTGHPDRVSLHSSISTPYWSDPIRPGLQDLIKWRLISKLLLSFNNTFWFLIISFEVGQMDGSIRIGLSFEIINPLNRDECLKPDSFWKGYTRSHFIDPKGRTDQ